MRAAWIVMGSLTLAAPLVGWAQAPVAAKASARRCDVAEVGKFDFWLGKWSGTETLQVDGKPQPGGTATVEVVPVLEGCALLERREVRLPQQTLKTLSLFAYDRDLKRWRLHFFDDADINQVWEGSFVNGRWEFSREREADGKKLLVRIVWIEAS